MLHKVTLDKELSLTDFKDKYESLELELIQLQRTVLEVGMPVVIAFEGWSASGKGTLINELSFPLDPRGFRVTEGRLFGDECSYLSPYWKNSPAKGFISIFDRSWYRAGIDDIFRNGETKKKYIRDASNFEQHLLNSDTLIIKFFLHISQNEQRKRLKDLTSGEHSAWRVTEADLLQNINYDRFRDACEYVIGQTSDITPWYIIEAEDRLYAKYKVLLTLVDCIKEALKKFPFSSENKIKLKVVEPSQHLKNIDLSKSFTQDEYKVQFNEATKDLRRLGFELYRQKVPMVIVYEGWDAAGKGGSIRRLTQFFDPRNYNVVPVAAPSKQELSHNYMWRFWKELPKKGSITIFDRSWYGRVLVERVEGFCRPDDWRRAYEEINQFEKHLVDQGVIYLKFWMEISHEEQLARFENRLSNSHKRWKITDEDWRNREKWEDYRPVVDEMLIRTDTEWAPWHIIEGNNKLFARVKTIDIVKNALLDLHN